MPERPEEEIDESEPSWKGFLLKWGEILPASNTEPLLVEKRFAIKIFRKIREMPVFMDFDHRQPVGSVILVDRDTEGIRAELDLDDDTPAGTAYPILTRMETDFKVKEGKAVLLVKYAELIGIGWIRNPEPDPEPERKPKKRRRRRG